MATGTVAATFSAVVPARHPAASTWLSGTAGHAGRPRGNGDRDGRRYLTAFVPNARQRPTLGGDVLELSQCRLNQGQGFFRERQLERRLVCHIAHFGPSLVQNVYDFFVGPIADVMLKLLLEEY